MLDVTSIWIVLCSLVQLAQADVVCDSRYGYPIRYCYGLTAYCCGEHFQDCCWEKIWKVWWFWVVAFIIITAIFSCCGYYCSSSAENGHYGLLRSDSFNVFHHFRRFSSRNLEEDEGWKPPEVPLPPYTPAASTSRVGTSVDPSPQPNMPYLEPPPPYTTIPTHPQPEADESTPLIPSAPQTNAQDSSGSYVTTTTTTVSSH